MKRALIVPKSLGHVYHLPRREAWEAARLPRNRARELVLQPWLCVNADHALVVNYRLLAAILRSVRKRNPTVTVSARFVDVHYTRGHFRLALHDATHVLGRIQHHYFREQHDRASQLHKVAPLNEEERAAV